MINTSLNLGQCAVRIAAEIKAESIQEVLQKGIEKLAYHASASKVYNAKGHARDEKFSDTLESDLRKGLNTVISPFCDSLKIEISEKPASKPKLSVEDILASVSVETLKAALAAREVPAEEVEEEVVAMG